MSTTYSCIISRYNENLQWTLEEPFNQLQYIVYNKGVNNDFVGDHVDKVIELPNVGKDVHSYLHHVVNNYDNLSDLLVFIPATMDVSYKRNKALTLIHNTIESKFQNAFFLGQHTISVEKLFEKYTQQQWVPTTAKNRDLCTGDSTLIASPIRPYGAWFQSHFPGQVAEWWSYNNTFSVDKRDILQHPKSHYEDLLLGLSVGNDVEEAHYVERSWCAIFGPFHHTRIIPYKM